MRRLAASLAALLGLAACGREPEPATEIAPRAAQETGAKELFGATLELSAEDCERMGLALAVPEPAELAPEVRAFGRVVSDPSMATVLRAPFAGTLLAGRIALTLGTELGAGQIVFRLVPRWSPQELADLSTRIAGVRAELAGEEAELPSLHAAAERARTLNAADQTVSDREREEAEGRLRIAEARVAGSRALLEALEGLASGTGRGELPLVFAGTGEVTELAAHAGEEVEANAVLLRTEDFRAPLLSIDVPLGVAASAITGARVEPSDGSATILAVERVGLAPAAGTGGLSAALLFRLPTRSPGHLGLRPGQLLAAWLTTGEAAQRGVRIPSAAVVRFAGQAFVYARNGADELARVPLLLGRPLDGGWFRAGDWSAGEVVVRGAQNVLSFELLGRQGEEEED